MEEITSISPDFSGEKEKRVGSRLNALYERFYGYRPTINDLQSLSDCAAMKVRGGSWAEVELQAARSEDFRKRVEDKLFSSSAEALNLLYQTLLKRLPDQPGFESYSAQLQAGTPVESIINSFLESDEYRHHLIDSLYWEYLGRGVEDFGLTDKLKKIKSGVSLESLREEIKSSEEATSSGRNGSQAEVLVYLHGHPILDIGERRFRGRLPLRDPERFAPQLPFTEVEVPEGDSIRLADLVPTGRLPSQRSNHERRLSTATQTSLENFQEKVDDADHIFFTFPHHIGDSLITEGYINAALRKLQKLGNQATTYLLVPASLYELLLPLQTDKLKVVMGGQVDPREERYKPQVRKDHPLNAGDKALEIIRSDPSIHNTVIFNFEDIPTQQPEVKSAAGAGKNVTMISGLFNQSFCYGTRDFGKDRFRTFAQDLFYDRDSSNEEYAMPILPLPPNHEDLYRNLAARCGVDTSNPNQLAINLEAGSSGRQYSIEQFALTARLIQERFPGLQINFIINPNKPSDDPTRVDTERLQQALDRYEVRQTHVISGNLAELVSFYHKQKVVLSDDGGMLHVAAATQDGPPVVGLYFPGYGNQWVTNPDRVTPIEAPPEGAPDHLLQWGEADEDKKWINKIMPGKIAEYVINQLAYPNLGINTADISRLNLERHLNSFYERFYDRNPATEDIPACLKYAQALAKGKLWTELITDFVKSEQFARRIYQLAHNNSTAAITALYQTVIGRSPSFKTREMLRNRFLSMNSLDDAKQAIEILLRSDDYRIAQIRRLYQEILNRDADDKGVEDKLAEMKDEGRNLLALAEAMRQSDEYKKLKSSIEPDQGFSSVSLEYNNQTLFKVK